MRNMSLNQFRKLKNILYILSYISIKHSCIKFYLKILTNPLFKKKSLQMLGARTN